MRNITLAIDDATYRRAPLRATGRGTSVSGLVRDLLQSLDASQASPEREAKAKAKAKAQFTTMDEARGYSALTRLTRAQAHEPARLR